MFFTSYLTRAGEEVKDSIKIAKRYVRTVRFATDILSVLGMDIFEAISDKLNLFGLFKIVRVLRLNAFIRNLPISAENKSLVNLAKLTFYMALWLHIIGCFLWVWVGVNKDVVRPRPTDGEEIAMMWYPPLDWVNYVDVKLYSEDTPFQYWSCLYNAVLILGMNELGPVNVEEFFYISAFLVGSIILSALMFGDIATLVDQIS